jgi:hypothetical protein
VWVYLLALVYNIILPHFPRSVVAIGCIVTCVLGFVQNTMGWELGVAESIGEPTVTLPYPTNCPRR